ncbi:MAG: fluoride efflux transporter CrcB [Flavobacteriaceae bacterium]|nr:fluoride efflux transporter CrcB [Bacteroidia bacterium]MBT8286436.1 fluoride efflux transporter CrcB [Bacteroidia bacterium]NNF75712.1 fluoride efflux transporter CrcB [Flavobacteriaceae bacterium]NNK74259.1 fluoride efflux transporter CrcB [Flavobacteriaceae bacterium]
MRAAILVFLGGGLGSVIRFYIGRSMNAASPSFPWGTFTVNLIGSFIIGLVFGWILEKSKLSENLLLFLVAGFCGGFTTFSAFTHESIALLRTGHTALFWYYLLASLAFGLFCVWLGYVIVKSI